jgi:single-strand DNA-binding protein
MRSLNKAMLIGNVGRDPEIVALKDGNRVAHMSLATSRRWRDKLTGETRERTEWHRIVIFSDKIVELVEKYVRKGGRIFVEGEIQTRKWKDQSGQDRQTTEIVLQGYDASIILLDRAGDDEGGGPVAKAERPRLKASAPHIDDGNGPLDDEIPF